LTLSAALGTCRSAESIHGVLMKYFLIAAVTLLPTLAHAKFVCSYNPGPDRGWIVRETKDGNAEVLMQSIMGPQLKATLECITPEGDGRNGNIPHVAVLCQDAAKTYQFTMHSGGVVGISADLRPQNQKPIPLHCDFFTNN
jgi:hypothetical protein